MELTKLIVAVVKEENKKHAKKSEQFKRKIK